MTQDTRKGEEGRCAGEGGSALAEEKVRRAPPRGGGGLGHAGGSPRGAHTCSAGRSLRRKCYFSRGARALLLLLLLLLRRRRRQRARVLLLRL
jgi:hypothetical protein